ncbi:SURF1 family protein [Mycetocola reblochoni]|nr:SURF1 family cytochrome oxidase biogenesis protein [Mycetocola reblochoni]
MTDDPREETAVTDDARREATEARPKAWSADEPRLLRVMLRPRWILLLVVAIAIAGAFAALGHWQLSRSVIEAEVAESGTETIVPVSEVATPTEPTRESTIGQRAEASGTLIAANTTVITTRLNDGVLGYWVIGSLIEGAHEPARVLPVALGWTEDREQADAVAARITAEGARAMSLTGRLAASEAPAVDEDAADPFELNSMSVPALINQWQGLDDMDVYSVYLISAEAPDGLTAITAGPPVAETTVNWLNIFYAAEWIVFAGFAVFLWFRLVRDAREREIDERAEADRTASGTP